ncbi:MAG TPA: hemerythrin domain-containing protein [Actinomycetota bacterium]|nr:hemerythrin domain-containing protein [Actinomycetota bacterium]
MKRHESLIPLTHDHHHALGQARRLKLSHTEPNDKRVERAREFLEFFGSETLTHFREEEEEIFPLAVGEPEAESVLARTMMEHLQIHAAVHRLSDQVAAGNAPGESLTRIGELLESHIRSEEKTVFPLIERLAPQALDAVELSPRKRTA